MSGICGDLLDPGELFEHWCALEPGHAGDHWCGDCGDVWNPADPADLDEFGPELHPEKFAGTCVICRAEQAAKGDLSVLVAELRYRGIHPDSIAVEVETAATRVEVAGGVSSQAGLASFRFRRKETPCA